MLRTSLLSLLALGLAAQQPAPAQAPVPAAAAPAPAPGPNPEEVILARVGGQPITEADFRAAFGLLGQQEQMQVLMMQGGKEEFVRRMAESKLLAEKAKRMGLDQTPGYLRSLERTKDDLLAREYLAKEGEGLQKKLAVAEPEVKAYYEGHKERFKQPEQVTVRHILISVKQDPNATTGATAGLTDAEAKAKVAKIQAELKKGAKFEDLAKKYSDDPGSKENGGLYADADPSTWVKEFGTAARTQPLGKVGAPVKTQFGYHLVKVESRKPSRDVPFEEGKAAAERMAQQERQMIVWTELMDGLRKEIPFELVKPATPAAVAAPAPVAPQGGGQ
ncbi:peptidylprolyl isomerase [Geothrix sp. 21YS21S-4]|uniref:peptidylprolyl isomerase n=1 Tax=Geothrix sp. 21YS21S-4 TaxID=3068889 RepID=UPI0027B949B0|nr:peptidylprolyl isomerase [Geothrix sp. 21YS21S-4]